MTTRARRHDGRVRPRRENTRGWWGILRASVLATAVAVSLATVVGALFGGVSGGASALLGGGAVLVLSAATLAVTAWAWDHARDHAIPLSIGAFVLKLVVFGVLLGVLRTPAWVDPVPAGAAALTAVVVWQGAELIVFSRTRRRIYD